MVKYCQFVLEDGRYCARPARLTQLPGYVYLCDRHLNQLDGRAALLAAANEKRRNSFKRICPTCEKVFYIRGYRKKSLRNFCSNACRAKFYWVPGQFDSIE